MAIREETEERVADLTRQLIEPSRFTFYVPEWEPVSFDVALRWMRSQLWEGFHVSYRVDADAMKVFFKFWEFGDDEPSWDDQEYAI